MKHFIKKIEDFECEVCHTKVIGHGYTDHCPKCLYSKHMDINPGDRMSQCGGLMKPVHAVDERTHIMITYKCEKCGKTKRVKAASEDDMVKLESLIDIKAASTH
ncbi:hypothetical protein B2A_00158 [mine drainage metagenome]|uniref:RNHCP domain-containing protein n=1 Tax=mine drainage metagenome TaxID=410659 RepID=T1CLT8_9ZZZZ